jgi:hypothetical protein
MPTDSEIQQALAPLVRGLDKIEATQERLIARIDNLPLLYMTRQEYEPRHVALEKLIEDQKEDLKQLKQRIDTKEQNAIAHNITVFVAIGSSLVAIALHFWK